MIDVLAPLGLLALVGFVIAIVLTARKQREARRQAFRRLAEAEGWDYLEEGKSVVETLAGDFEGFGQFWSPSLGKLTPEAAVVGRTEQGRVCCFLHGTREHEGQARLWTVCLVEARDRLCASLRIRPRDVREVREVGGDPSVRLDDPELDERFAVTAPDPEAARACFSPEVRRFLLSEHARLPFPVGIQIRDRRAAAYLARRNDRAPSESELRALVRFTQGFVAALLRSGG